jgi:hypothetical protein
MVTFKCPQPLASYFHLFAQPTSRRDGEIFDSDGDDDLSSVKQILASSKQMIKVVDLTGDDDDNDREGNDGDFN